MPTLIRQAQIIAMDAAHGSTPFTGDIRIDGDSIAGIGPSLPPQPDDTVIDGRDKLVIPGLVNGHLHSSEALFKGRYDNMPLELWMLYSYPILGDTPPGERLIYLRSMVCAMESLKNGTTTVVDDVYEVGGQTMEQIAAVFDAYDDAGIRANISGHIVDRPFLDTIPFTREMVPAELQAKAGMLKPPSIGPYIEQCKEAFVRFQDRAGRLRFMIAPSAPQRCTPELMQAADELARAHGSPFHTHILETKTQCVTGPEFYGKTLIRYMYDMGLLHAGTTIAHSIWVTDADIEIMGDVGCSIVHNCISNQKLGAGIAPLRKLLDAGVNVALGSDGICSNDTARMFDVMHAAGLLHSVSTPDNNTWISADEVLRCATITGARSGLIDHLVGSLEVGKKADLVILDLRSINFSPANDLRNHLVYCENGSSIETVMVNGEVVMQGGTLTRVNEGDLLAELREAWDEYRPIHARNEQLNAQFHPSFAAIHQRCTSMDVGINRYGSDMPAWLGHNAAPVA